MSIIDYGSICKKNDKVVQINFSQNFSSLKYSIEYKKDDNGEYLSDPETGEFIKTDDSIDETIVKIKYKIHEKDENGFYIIDDDHVIDEKIVEQSMAGNFYTVIGNEKCLIGFYKNFFQIAYNKVVEEFNHDPRDWFWGESEIKHSSHKKPLILDFPIIGKMKISLLNKDCDRVFRAEFNLYGDHYDVVYGYGVDADIRYVYGKGRYKYYTTFGPRRIYDFNKGRYIPANVRLKKNANLRGLRKSFLKWYEGK